MPSFGNNKDNETKPPVNHATASKAGMPSNIPPQAKPSVTPAGPSKAGMPSNIPTQPKPSASPAAAPAPALKSMDVIVKEVIHGDWGNGAERKQKLEAAGYSYSEVQAAVDRAMAGKAVNLDAVAADVIKGVYGNGAERKQKLEAAGYDYNAVQAAVNAKMAGKPVASSPDLDAVARDVIKGVYGNGAERKQKLEAAGYDYNAVQARVDQLLR
jgi:hypothetical protein